MASATIARPSLSLSQSFGYDAYNRLTSAAETGGSNEWPAQTYSYDAFGNRAVTAGYIPNPCCTPTALSQYTNNQWLGTSVSYDAAGNQKTLPSRSFTYDAENRVITATEPNMPAISYVYDGEGKRVQKTVGTAITNYVYDAFGQLTAEYATQSSTNGLLYLTADPLGSTRLITSSTGAVQECNDYFPFGEDIQSTLGGRGSCYPSGVYPSSPDIASQKFTGKERDAETGMDYFGARYFSGPQGRFTSADPFTVTPSRVVDPQQLNLYAYVRNNPLKHIDPTGMVIDDAACQADKKCAKAWQRVQEIANQTDDSGAYVHPELHNVLSALQSDSRTFALENSKLDPGKAGRFTITNFTAGGKDFTGATLQLDLKQIRGISGVTAADLVPGFNKFEGLLNAPLDRVAETFGHEGAHGLFSIQNPVQAVGIQQLLNERDAAMQGQHYPYPPDVMQKIEAAEKGLIPTEKFAQQEEKVINGELQADKKKQ